ncbi:recombinase family protein [Legionella sp. km772]|uniref:recombinase family protein n=1 Tax=Legionella sp. km772 TaxID=2498111 RepID=UPI000F8CF4B0|nr:recombinase family protein [Legionella sp. km772]RUR13509.1 recombinase family protein [Legionella sp. km772]
MSYSQKNCVLYTRVSSKEQEKEGFSIPAQQKLLRTYAIENQFLVAKEFQDIETAKQSGRVGFADMMNFLTANPTIKTLLVEKTDRLYRNLKDWVTIEELDLEVHFVKENEVLSESSRSTEKFMHGIRVLMAKNYIDNLSEETRKGMNEKAEQGIWPSFAPLGYLNVTGDDGKKIIIPDKENAQFIVQLYEWYGSGKYSIKELSKMAKESGMIFRKSKNPVNKSTIQKILRNRIYMGEFEWNQKVHKGNHQPLVDAELWEQCQQILSGRYSVRTKSTKHQFAFSGLITCGHCHSGLVGEIKKGKYIYYHCTGHKGKCPEPYVREEVLEEKFSSIVKKLQFTPEALEWIKEALLQSNQDVRQFHDEAITRLQAEYQKLESRIQAMYIDKLDGKILGDFFESMSSKWREEQSVLLSNIQKHQNASQHYLLEGIQLIELARNAYSLFIQQVPIEKRRLLQFLVSNSSWAHQELQVELRQPFDLIMKLTEQTQDVDVLNIEKSATFENWLPGQDSNL